jgi:hypothetical protein
VRWVDDSGADAREEENIRKTLGDAEYQRLKKSR